MTDKITEEREWNPGDPPWLPPVPESAYSPDAVDLPAVADHPATTAAAGAATPEQWRAAYDAKVADFARETARLTRLVNAVVADGHRADGLTRHTRSCGVCIALREVVGSSDAEGVS